MVEDLLQEDGGRNGDEDANPESIELMAKVAYHLEEHDILFGNLRWLENFREMTLVHKSSTLAVEFNFYR